MDLNYFLALNFDTAMRTVHKPQLTDVDRMHIHQSIANHVYLLQPTLKSKIAKVETLAKNNNYQPVVFNVNKDRMPIFIYKNKQKQQTPKSMQDHLDYCLTIKN